MSIHISLDFYCPSDLSSSLTSAISLQFNSICVPLVHPRYHRTLITRADPLTRSDLALDCTGKWSTQVYGKISQWINLDAVCKETRERSEKAFKEEVGLASHLHIKALVLESPGIDSINYARVVKQSLMKTSILFMVRLSMSFPSFEIWNAMRTACNFDSKLTLCLEIPNKLPPVEEQDRWCGEPVRAVVMSPSLFIANKKGCRVLSKAHQKFFIKLYKSTFCDIIFKAPLVDDDLQKYSAYLRYLIHTNPFNDQETFESPFFDFLQSPLQPLKDHLEASTYEVFEKDPVKYFQYENAIYRALIENKEFQCVMVVGAGRGPLVDCVLRAAKSAERNLIVYAVEKNPNAIITLKNRKIEWGNSVTVIDADMRKWQPPVLADILVSELLGSFGDNELSPECLDGAQRLLKSTGISIPSKYTSYISPISTCKLWNSVRSYRSESSFDIPYVVKLHNFFEMAPAVPCFTFSHPSSDVVSPHRNARQGKFEFLIQQSSLMHGFAGYFHTTLFHDVDLSIVPETFSVGMFSWFPIFFPLQNPIYITKGTKVEVCMWRLVSDSKVWYEWCVNAPFTTPIQNSNGSSYYIGL